MRCSFSPFLSALDAFIAMSTIAFALFFSLFKYIKIYYTSGYYYYCCIYIFFAILEPNSKPIYLFSFFFISIHSPHTPSPLLVFAENLCVCVFLFSILCSLFPLSLKMMAAKPYSHILVCITVNIYTLTDACCFASHSISI